MKSPDCSAPPGRPRSFCVDQALDRALKSLSGRKVMRAPRSADLTAAMGINRPSLYAAYGNKEALFRKALDRYIKESSTFLRRSMEQPTSHAVVEHLLLSSADGVTCPDNPHGCLTVRCALASGEAADSIRLELVKRRADGESILRKRLERAQSEGDLPAESNPADSGPLRHDRASRHVGAGRGRRQSPATPSGGGNRLTGMARMSGSPRQAKAWSGTVAR